MRSQRQSTRIDYSELSSDGASSENEDRDPSPVMHTENETSSTDGDDGVRNTFKLPQKVHVKTESSRSSRECPQESPKLDLMLHSRNRAKFVDIR